VDTSTEPEGQLFAIRVTRRSALGAAAVGLGALVLSACGGTQAASPSGALSPSGSGAPAAKPSAGASSQPKAGGTLNMGQVGQGTSSMILDGHSQGTLQNDVVFQAFDPLLQFDVDLKPQPMLAESWDQSTDNKQFKMNLRKGVQYHTGREFTSDDVKYNLLRVRDPKLAAIAFQHATPSKWWTTIDTPDKNTVVLKSDEPRPGVFDEFQKFNLVDKETADDKTKSIGTGPFVYDNTGTDTMTYKKNKSYWQSGKPYIDGFVTHILRDPQAMIAQLEAGAIDLADFPATNDVVRLSKDSNYNVIKSNTTGQFYYVGVNALKPPFDKKEVRQGLMYAIDRKRWADQIEFGLAGEAQDLPWIPSSPASEPAKNTVFTYDLDKAKSRFAAAGTPSFETEITLGQNYRAEFSQLAQVLQADLAKMGVTITKINLLDQAAFTDTLRKGTYTGIHMFASNFGGNLEASFLFNAGGNFDIMRNYFGPLKNDTWIDLVNRASSEPDPAKRKAIYSQINDFLLDQAFGITLTRQLRAAITKSKVQGVQMLDYRGLLYTDTWIG
jgi:peptide/nickel transport system substrate-binding protein